MRCNKPFDPGLPHESAARRAEVLLLSWYEEEDHESFDDLFGCLDPLIQKMVKRILIEFRDDSDDSAPELCQEVWIKIFKTKSKPSTRFDPNKGSFLTWLSTIIRHEVQRSVRRYRYREDSLNSSDDPMGERSPAASTQEDMFAMLESQDMLFVLKKHLTDLEFQVLLLRAEDYSFPEISRKLAIPTATAYRIFKRAQNKAKNALKDLDL